MWRGGCPFPANSVTVLTLERTFTTPKYVYWAYTAACVSLVMTGFALTLTLVLPFPLALTTFTLSSYSLFFLLAAVLSRLLFARSIVWPLFYHSHLFFLPEHTHALKWEHSTCVMLREWGFLILIFCFMFHHHVWRKVSSNNLESKSSL